MNEIEVVRPQTISFMFKVPHSQHEKFCCSRSDIHGKECGQVIAVDVSTHHLHPPDFDHQPLWTNLQPY